MHVIYTNRSGDIPDLPYEWKPLDELLKEDEAYLCECIIDPMDLV